MPGHARCYADQQRYRFYWFGGITSSINVARRPVDNLNTCSTRSPEAEELSNPLNIEGLRVRPIVGLFFFDMGVSYSSVRSDKFNTVKTALAKSSAAIRAFFNASALPTYVAGLAEITVSKDSPQRSKPSRRGRTTSSISPPNTSLAAMAILMVCLVTQLGHKTNVSCKLTFAAFIRNEFHQLRKAGNVFKR